MNTTHATTIHRAMLAARHAACTDDSRAGLCSMRVEPEGETGTAAISTDGHRLIAITSGEPCAGARLIPASAVDALAKAAGAPRKAVATQLNCESATLGNGISIPTPEVHQRFPDWRQWVTVKPTARVTLDARYLEDMAKAAREFAAASGELAHVTVEVADPLSPVAFRVGGDTSLRFAGYIMPCRVQAPAPED